MLYEAVHASRFSQTSVLHANSIFTHKCTFEQNRQLIITLLIELLGLVAFVITHVQRSSHK